MKTKIQVVNDIQTTINDGGQNTALEVRNILIEIVDFVQDLSDLSSGNIDGLLKKLIQLENRLQLLWDNVGYDEKEGATIQVQIKRLRKEIIRSEEVV